uniref:Uncharacterized protein n=1 Tax=Mycena chlorophos TaxID=658473 RepID=A0ABQ0L9I7_MYCCL|nr:predicted protein [Mycena chlorophos]
MGARALQAIYPSVTERVETPPTALHFPGPRQDTPKSLLRIPPPSSTPWTHSKPLPASLEALSERRPRTQLVSEAVSAHHHSPESKRVPSIAGIGGHEGAVLGSRSSGLRTIPTSAPHPTRLRGVIILILGSTMSLISSQDRRIKKQRPPFPPGRKTTGIANTEREPFLLPVCNSMLSKRDRCRILAPISRLGTAPAVRLKCALSFQRIR